MTYGKLHKVTPAGEIKIDSGIFYLISGTNFYIKFPKAAYFTKILLPAQIKNNYIQQIAVKESNIYLGLRHNILAISKNRGKDWHIVYLPVNVQEITSLCPVDDDILISANDYKINYGSVFKYSNKNQLIELQLDVSNIFHHNNFFLLGGYNGILYIVR